MKNTDIDALFDNDKWYEWSAKELRKLLKVEQFDRLFFTQLDLLLRCVEIIDPLIIKTSAERCDYVKTVTERYFATKGEMPDSHILERLATWILAVDDDENSGILSERQMRTRNKEKEVSFHTPEHNAYAMALDGNRYVKPRPGMDSDESHKVRVRTPSDKVDKRMYNGPLEKYLLN